MVRRGAECETKQRSGRSFVRTCPLVSIMGTVGQLAAEEQPSGRRSMGGCFGLAAPIDARGRQTFGCHKRTGMVARSALLQTGRGSPSCHCLVGDCCVAQSVHSGLRHHRQKTLPSSHPAISCHARTGRSFARSRSQTRPTTRAAPPQTRPVHTRSTPKRPQAKGRTHRIKRNTSGEPEAPATSRRRPP